MLLRGSTREATESSKESSAAPAASSQRFLWCHCDHYCPTDSTNNTCRYGATWRSHYLPIIHWGFSVQIGRGWGFLIVISS